jgi:hypothetical protein
LGSVGDTIAVTGLADKRYLMVLHDLHQSGQIDHYIRLNSDTGSNYAYRLSSAGGGDATLGSSNKMVAGVNGATVPCFDVSYISNLSTKEKLLINHSVGETVAGAGTAPNRRESVGKWANTSNAVSAVTSVNNQSGDYASGSEVVVLGWDPADTHTSNFWEELASVNLSGGAASSLSSGTFTAKKYLWVQVYLENSGSINVDYTMNNDTGSNYAIRYSSNGAADATSANAAKFDILGTVSYPIFANMFIINNSANEKLVIQNAIGQNTAGAGTAPTRQEIAGKWANTAAQITSITFTNTGTGDFGTDSILKVWGSD